METLANPQTGKPVTENKKAEQSTECTICHLAVSYIRLALADNQTQDEIEKVLGLSNLHRSEVAGTKLFLATAPLGCRWFVHYRLHEISIGHL
jgi:hypothetical protein